MALQCKFLELVFQSKDGTPWYHGGPLKPPGSDVSLSTKPSVGGKMGDRVTVKLSGSHRDICGLHRFVCVT